ncbi:MAG: peptidoglycan DD-metalloendopeptidase family protein [Candidatus Paceibacterota bacterium]
MTCNRYTKYLAIIFLALSCSSLFCTSVLAQTKEEIQQRIADRNRDIANLEIEIAKYQNQISELGTQANSLSATVKSLDLNQKKLAADISLTENKIAAKNLEVQDLGGRIVDKEEAIIDDHRVISASFSTMSQLDQNSILELMLAGKSISGAIESVDQVATIQNRIVERIHDLREVKASLEANKHATEKAKQELVILTNQIKDQRKVVLSTQSEKNTLLKETKQSESQYQRLLAQKRAEKALFDKEILDYEAQLKTIVNAASLPHVGSGILAWPLDSVFITQYFGDTPFSTANPQIYNGKGHTGVDFRAAIGTPIKSSLSGIVVGVGDTDLFPGCYSYGRWVMVKHANGLSTLYAHMSLPTASVGQAVNTGEVIGYSGNTGYSTGPHLHFGVYATEGVEIKKFTNSRSCKNAVIPVASFNAYLNPLSYL